jgi:phage tail P2-like protein
VSRFPSLLPPNNSGAAELAIEQATGGITLLPDAIRPLWDPDTCPASLLPWLAWTLSVDKWEPTWTEAQKREVIKASVEIHRRKGTVWAIRRALEAAGLGDAVLTEGFGRKFYDGTYTHNGAQDHSTPDHWAEYRVTLTRPLSIAQGQQARAIIEATAPLRCRLKSLDFTDVPNLENGGIRHDGTFTHGET